jgi:hypothetical protein
LINRYKLERNKINEITKTRIENANQYKPNQLHGKQLFCKIPITHIFISQDAARAFL